MPLLRNYGQPYFPDPNSPAPLDCGGDYCYPIVPNDKVRAQFYQTPCGANLITDPTFTDFTLGSELLVGSFTEDPADSWAYDVFFNRWTYDPAYLTNTLTQSVAITAGTIYRLTFTLSGILPGNFLDIYLGSTTITTTINGNGDIVLDLVAGSDNTDLVFSAISVGAISIENISLKEFGLNDWDTNGGWQVGEDNQMCHVSGTGALIQTVANYIVSGSYYRVTVTVSGRTTGTVTPRIAGTSGTAISSNGTFTQYITAGSNGVGMFVPSSNFDGCISYPDIRLLRNDYSAEAITELGNGDVYDISSYLSYYEDKITLEYDPLDDNLPYGCFIITMYDECDVQYGDFVTNGNFAGGSGNTCPDWTKNNDGTMYNFDSSNCKLIRSSSGQTNAPILKNLANEDMLAGNYLITFDIISNTDTTGIGATVAMDSVYFGSYFTTVGTHTITINGYDPDNPVTTAINKQRIMVVGRFNNDGTPHTGEIVIDNVTAYRIEPFDASYITDCISYQASHPNTKLITAYCDRNQLGFDFENTGFVLEQRMVCRSLNPIYDKTKQISQFSTGNSKLTYAQTSKSWQFVTEFLSESAHDGLSTQLDCDHFLIGNTAETQKEYIANAEDYQPEWRAGGDYNLAPVTINLKIKEGNTKFNRQCDTD